MNLLAFEKLPLYGQNSSFLINFLFQIGNLNSMFFQLMNARFEYPTNLKTTGN